MKTRLYIFGVITLLCFVIVIGYSISRGISNIKRTNTEMQAKEQPDDEHIWSSTIPVNFDRNQLVDSVYNKQAGYWMPIKAQKGTIIITEQINVKKVLVSILFILTSLIAIPTLMVCFYKIINAIKSAIIFDKKNISRLRIIGFMFMAIGITYSLHSIIESWETASLLEGSRYYIEKKAWFKYSFIIYGFISFLLAEAFSVGLKLKEEQDLTI